MVIIYILLVAHFVGDFIYQSDWMALNKSKRWDALAAHVAAYMTVLIVCLVPFVGTLGEPSHANDLVYLFLAVNAVAHFVQDAITSRINAKLWFIDGVREKNGPNGPRGVFGPSSFAGLTQYFEVAYNDKRHWFFVGIGADQLLHYVTLFVTAGWWLY